MKGKPCPWEINSFLLCSKRDIVYNNLLYQGATIELDQKPLKIINLAKCSFPFNKTFRKK